MNGNNSARPFTNANARRQVGILTVFRLGLFNLGLGLMAVLTLAVLNRVMISELGIPATITAGVLSLYLFVAPARVWFGQLSDTQPIFGKHRTSYVLSGTAVFGVAVFLAVQVVWQLGAVVRDSGGWLWNAQTIGWTALLALIMVVYGLAVSASSTPFTALLVDISEEENRSKLVSVIWSMLMVGIIIGGLSGSLVFKGIEAAGVVSGQIPLETLQTPINRVFSFVPALVLAMAVIATWRVEKTYSRFTTRLETSDREDKVTLARAIKILTASRQTGIFFSFLCLLTISLFMQEAVLEPYGGEVFGMSIGETTMLNSYWGTGILLGYSLAGFLIVPRLGKKLSTKIGCSLVAVCFISIVIAGFIQQKMVLLAALLLFGATTGIATVGGISLMLDLTAAATAGTFIGAWGLAQAISRGAATFMGGVILDLGKAIFATPLMAYSLVFALQAIVMLGAIAILNRVNVKEFQETTGKAVATVMEADLDG